MATAKDSVKKDKSKKLMLRPVPVLAYAPETRFIVGVGLISPFQWRRDSITHHSIISAYIVYTQNKQDYIYMPYQVFTTRNEFYFEGESDYYNYSYYYWGIGENRVPKELYNVKFPRFLLNAYRKIEGKFYLGIDYYYENDMMFNNNSDSALNTQELIGGNGSVSSGIGVDILFDTRDSIFFPHHGWYIKGVSYFNSTQLGATQKYGKAITDVSWYHSLTKSTILALTQHNQVSWGDVPFNQLALIGGTRQIRGYYMGYYRDNVLSYFQGEARVHLFDRVGGVVFGTISAYGNFHTFPENPVPIFAEGVGLRYNYVKKQHINLRADIAFGVSPEYYLTIQESF